MLRPTIYYILAGPAFFLPFAYFCILPAVLLLPSGGETAATIDAQPTLRHALLGTLEMGYIATLVQWPLYLLWAAASREARPRIRVSWIIFIVIGNMIAMPVFLYAKFQRNLDGILVGAIRNQKIRSYLQYETQPRTT